MKNIKFINSSSQIYTLFQNAIPAYLLFFLINGLAIAQQPFELLNAWSSNTENGITYPGCEQWKITYPTGEEEKDLCSPVANNRTEFYFVNEEGNGIVFRAPVRSDNGTTPNSSNIRSELRERNIDGRSDAFWTTEGHHIIYVEQAITHLPIVKDELVATQIHGNKDEGIDDALVVRLEGSHLFLSFNGGKLRSNVTITNNYILGTVHEVIFEVINDKHYVYYSEDGNLKTAFENGEASKYLVTDAGDPVLMDIYYRDAYFRAGNYTQSNPNREGSQTDDPENYGEVVLYDMYVNHNGDGAVPTIPVVQCNAIAPTSAEVLDIEQTTATLNWDYDGAIDYYNVRYKSTDLDVWTELSSLKLSEGAITLAGFTVSLDISELAVNTDYEWQVSATCADGTTSNYTDGTNFTTRSACVADIPASIVADNVGQTEVTFNWTFNGEIDHYNIRYRPIGTDVWIALNSQRLSENEFTVTDAIATKNITSLTSNTTYEWEVRAKCADGTSSPYTAGNTFSTTTCIANVPELTTVSDLTKTSVTFNWAYDSGLEHYNLRYRPVGTTDWQMRYLLKVSDGSITIFGNIAKLSVNNLIGDTAYEWEVNGVCAATDNSDGASASAFTAGEIFTTTTCTANDPDTVIATNITATSATFNWTYNADIDHYNVRYRQTGTSTWIPLNSLRLNEQEFIVSETSIASKIITELMPNIEYEWQVRAKCADGTASAYTAGNAFVTVDGEIPVMPEPTCIATVPNVIETSDVGETYVTFNWTFDEQIDHYNIRYRPTGTDDWIALNGLRLNEEEFTVAEASIASKIVTELPSNVEYEWQVRAKCADGTSSPYTAGDIFTTTTEEVIIMPEPTCVATVPNIIETSNVGETYVTFNWTFDAQIDHYNIRYRPTGTDVWIALNGLRSNEEEFVVSEVSIASKIVSELTSNIEYEWEVRAKCADGTSSAYTAGDIFITTEEVIVIPEPTCIATVPNIIETSDVTETSVTFNWTFEEQIDHYNIRYRPSGTDVWIALNGLRLNEEEFVASEASIASKVVTELTPDTNYEWEVRAKCADGTSSPYTAGDIFNTTEEVIVIPEPTCIATVPNIIETSDVTETSVTFNWTFEEQIDHYNIRYRPSGTDVWIALNGLRLNEEEFTVSEVSIASKVVTELTPDTNYEWEVRAKCADGTSSPYTAGDIFNTLKEEPTCIAIEPEVRTVTDITETSATLNWTFDVLIDHYNIRFKPVNTDAWVELISLKESEGTISVSEANASISLTDLESNTAYEWQIRAKCSDTDDLAPDYIAGENFTTLEEVCDVPWSTDAISISDTTLNYNSAAIDISCASPVSISMLIQAEGNMETSDFLNIYYSVDGGELQVISENVDSFATKEVYVTDITGESVEIIISSATSISSEVYTVSNIKIEEGDFVPTTPITPTETVVHIRKRNAPDFAIDGNKGAANSQNIYLWSENENNVNQQWVEIDRGDGYFSYKKMNTSHCIDGGNGGRNKQNVYLWQCNDNNYNQHWKKVAVADGAYMLVKRNATGYAIDGGNRGANRQNVGLFDASNPSQNLHWFITPIGSAKSANIVTGGGVIIFPNPVQTTATIQGAVNTSISLYDMNGKLHLSKDIVLESEVIDLGFLSSGMYYVQIVGPKILDVIKIIKE